jgi:quercetin dioxygenase-like cupin family protein
MINRVYPTEFDRTNLSKYRTIEGEPRDTFDYKNIIVKKPWGYEYLLFENDNVAIWILHIKNNESTSIHCHPGKKTSLVVLSGKVMVSTLSDWFKFHHLDGIIFESGVFHTTKALSEDVFVMEIETPPNKKDLVRLKDFYGRENSGYEGKSKMTKKLKKYKHTFFDSKALVDAQQQFVGESLLEMFYISKAELNFELDNVNENKLFVLVDGMIEDHISHESFNIGNIFSFNQLKCFDNIKLIGKSLLLSISKL